MTLASNTLASRNGAMIEKQILGEIGARHMYPGSLVDAYVEGKPVEIKSCQEKVCDSSHSNSVRSGRFAISKEQHDHLLENDGIYIFVVHDNGDIVRTKVAQAEELELPDFEYQKQIAWPKVVDPDDDGCSWERMYELCGVDVP